MNEGRKAIHIVSLLVIIGAVLIGCGPQSTPVVIEKVVKETVVVTRVVEKVVTATPIPKPTATPTPNPATGALQELVAAVVLRTDYRDVSNVAGAANLYVTYVDEGVRAKLIAYRAAKEGRSGEEREQMLRKLEGRLRERNEFPVLLYVQPAAGTTIGHLDMRLGYTPQRSESGIFYPSRFDSVFRKEVTSNAAGFFYFPQRYGEGILVIDPERDAMVEFVLTGGLSNGRLHLGIRDYIFEGRYQEDIAGWWPAFQDSFYIDLLPTDTSLALLPDVVAEYIVGEKPSAPPPTGLDVNVQWNLSARDVLNIIEILLKFLAMMGV